MKSILLVKKLLGLVEMMSGLVNASFSLPEWQAIKMIFFAAWTVHPLGEAHVKVEYLGSQHTLPLLIVHKGTGALFGQNWRTDVKLDWKNLPGLNHVGSLPCRPSTHPETLGNQTLASVLEKYSELFQPQLGCYTGDPVTLY